VSDTVGLPPDTSGPTPSFTCCSVRIDAHTLNSAVDAPDGRERPIAGACPNHECHTGIDGSVAGPGGGRSSHYPLGSQHHTLPRSQYGSTSLRDGSSSCNSPPDRQVTRFFARLHGTVEFEPLSTR